MALPNSSVALHRDLASVSIDPVTKVDIETHLLSAGTVVLDVRNVLRRADVRQLASVTIHTRDEAGRSVFARVETSALRAAVT
jgi:hypothetical protein